MKDETASEESSSPPAESDAGESSEEQGTGPLDAEAGESSEEQGTGPLDAEAGESIHGGGPPSGRRAAFAAGRAVAVLVVAAVGYQLVVPQTHEVRARLSRLALTSPGVAKYKVKSPQAAEQPAAETQLTAVESAAKKSPNKTGVYSVGWTPSQSSGAGVLVYLLPTSAQAEAALPQVRAQQSAAGSYTSQGLTRRSTFALSAVPGSSGAAYTPTSKGSGAPGDLAVTTFRYGRVVAAVEVVGPSDTQADAGTITTGEYDLLRRMEPGFTLSKVTRPVLATSLWIVGAVLLAAVVALAPAAWRRRAERRQKRIDEELSHLVVVRGQTISKHRR